MENQTMSNEEKMRKVVEKNKRYYATRKGIISVFNILIFFIIAMILIKSWGKVSGAKNEIEETYYRLKFLGRLRVGLMIGISVYLVTNMVACAVDILVGHKLCADGLKSVGKEVYCEHFKYLMRSGETSQELGEMMSAAMLIERPEEYRKEAIKVLTMRVIQFVLFIPLIFIVGALISNVRWIELNNGEFEMVKREIAILIAVGAYLVFLFAASFGIRMKENKDAKKRDENWRAYFLD